MERGTRPIIPQQLDGNPLAFSHEPSYEYSYRIPSPPRIVVPPPPVGTAIPTHRSFSPPIHVDFESNDLANRQFLDTVTFGDSTQLHNILDWKYEWRRKAQKVLPFMYLGPIGSMKDRKYLRQEGITMLLAVRNTSTAHAKLLDGSKVAADLGIQYQAIDVAGNPELIAAFPRAINAVNNHLSEVYGTQQTNPVFAGNGDTEQPASRPTAGKVLVYCESGNERSAGVVAAYLMAMYHVSITDAVQIIQGQRFCACFDDSLKYLLQSYQTILEAKRDVARSNRSTPHPPQKVNIPTSNFRNDEGAAGGKRGKRMLDDTYGGDTEMEDGYDQMDLERFEQRQAFAPFK
ncbi:MAG: hypothetical protein M1835_000197 [Candelina submexicana]|nr:MAG: hypothetical protein M1835_000197 [Candelina submexicana]